MILISTLTVLMFFGGSHPPTDISFFQAEDGIRCFHVTGVQTCALPISARLIAGVTAKVLRDGPTASGLWHLTAAGRSEERRVGKESGCRWGACEFEQKGDNRDTRTSIPLLPRAVVCVVARRATPHRAAV